MAKASGMINVPLVAVTGTVGREAMMAAMNAIHGYMVSVGLTPVVKSETFNLASDSVPTTEEAPTSKWLIYAFSDEFQAEFPIYVAIRIGVWRWSTNRYWGFQTCVGEGVNETGSGLTGRVTISSGGVNSSSGSSSLFWNVSATYPNKGDAVRYDGQALTALIGIDARDNGTLNYPRPLILLHVERMRRRSGEVEQGYSALLDDHTYLAAYNQGAALYRTNAAGSTTRSTNGFVRSGGADGLFDGGAPAVGTVWTFSESDQCLVPLRNIFTIPVAGYPDSGAVITLDFLGDERPYLVDCARKLYPYLSTLGLLFAWE